MPIPVMEVDTEPLLQEQSVENSAMLVLSAQITSHKEAFHYPAALRAAVTLAALSLLGIDILQRNRETVKV